MGSAGFGFPFICYMSSCSYFFRLLGDQTQNNSTVKILSARISKLCRNILVDMLSVVMFFCRY